MYFYNNHTHAYEDAESTTRIYEDYGCEYAETKRFDKDGNLIHQEIDCYRMIWEGDDEPMRREQVRFTEKQIDPKTGYWAVSYTDYSKNQCGYANSEGIRFVDALEGIPRDPFPNASEPDTDDLWADIFGEEE